MTRPVGGYSRGVLGAGTLLLLVLGTGCGPRVGEVTGKVLYQGKPLPSGTVLFVGPDGSRRGFSPIATDGSYRIQQVPVGPVKIAVVSEPRVPRGLLRASGPGPQAPDRAKGDYVPIPDRYQEPDRSGLTYTVGAGKQIQDILLMP